MARPELTPVTAIWNSIAGVATPLLPAAMLSLPVVRAVLDPRPPMLVRVVPLHLLHGSFGLLWGQFLLLPLLALGRRLSLDQLLLSLGSLLLPFLLLTPGVLLFFLTGRSGWLKVRRLHLTRRFPLRPRLIRPRLRRWFLRSLLGLLSLRIRLLLLPFRPGFLFLIRSSRLLFALIVLSEARSHGFEKQGQDPQVDESK